MSLNKVFIMGRIVKDPELKYTQTSVPVCGFSLAVERNYKEKNGERSADFIDVVAWRGTAEFVSKYFKKGKMAIVDGKLQIREWIAQDGTKRRSAEVVADHVYFGDSKREGTDGTYQNDTDAEDGFIPLEEEGELPF